MKAISLRLDNRLGSQFDNLCKQLGYKKNTLLTRMIASFVAHKKNTLSSKTTSKNKRLKSDPFLSVIGIVSTDPLLSEEDSIDKVVYNL